MAKPVKKAPAKKAAAKKSAPKAKAKVSAKPAAKPTGKVVSHASFMWKLLEKKEQQRKSLQEQQSQSKFNMHKMDKQTPTVHEGFHRFAGPRRKAV